MSAAADAASRGVEVPGCPSARLPHAEGMGAANATRFTLLAAYPEPSYPSADREAFKAAAREFVLETLIDYSIDGATITEALGMYGRLVEPSIRVEVIGSLSSDPALGNRLMEVAETIAIEWQQEEVWISSDPISLFKIKGTE